MKDMPTEEKSGFIEVGRSGDTDIGIVIGGIDGRVASILMSPDEADGVAEALKREAEKVRSLKRQTDAG